MSDQLQPEDTLDDRGVDDVLDEGYSPPEKPRGVFAKSVTGLGQIEGETIEERLLQEEPEEQPSFGEDEDDPAPPGAVGDERAGRLVAPDEGVHEDRDQAPLADDIGIDGAGASAEEAAMHLTEEPEGPE